MKKKLYLITSDFPYGKGEGSFIMPELPYLREKFDITIISNSLSQEQTVFLDDDIHIIHYDRKASLLQKIWDSICYLSRKDSYIELWDILSSKKKIFRRLFESLLFFEEARRFERFLTKKVIINQSEPAIIYNYWYTYYCLSMIHLFGSNPNIKIIARSHRYDLYDEGYLGNRQPFKRQMNSQIDAIIFIAEHGLHYYMEQYKLDLSSPKYQLFRLGVRPIGKPMPYKPTDDCTYLLISCSMVNSRKRVDVIIDALTYIHDINIKWVHFGDGDDFDKLYQKAVNDLSPLDNIDFSLKGYVDSTEILKFYNNNYVDAFITTTTSEGCPVSIQEAMAYGIPIIGTAVAEIPYMIQGNGVLLETNPSPQTVSNAITYILNSSESDKQEMRKASYHLWQKHFNADINASAFANYLYSEVLPK